MRHRDQDLRRSPTKADAAGARGARGTSRRISKAARRGVHAWRAHQGAYCALVVHHYSGYHGRVGSRIIVFVHLTEFSARKVFLKESRGGNLSFFFDVVLLRCSVRQCCSTSCIAVTC